LYKIFHEWLKFWWKFIKLIFKSKLQSTVFVVSICCALLFFSAKLNLKDCIDGAKYLFSFL